MKYEGSASGSGVWGRNAACALSSPRGCPLMEGGHARLGICRCPGWKLGLPWYSHSE